MEAPDKRSEWRRNKRLTAKGLFGLFLGLANGLMLGRSFEAEKRGWLALTIGGGSLLAAIVFAVIAFSQPTADVGRDRPSTMDKEQLH